MVKLYHYTSRVNVEEILRIGCLRRSTKHPIGWIDGKMLKNGAAFFTEKDPYNFTKEEIAKNNWGHGWKERVDEGLVDAYIVIDVEEGNREFVFDSDPRTWVCITQAKRHICTRRTYYKTRAHARGTRCAHTHIQT